MKTIRIDAKMSPYEMVRRCYEAIMNRSFFNKNSPEGLLSKKIVEELGYSAEVIGLIAEVERNQNDKIGGLMHEIRELRHEKAELERERQEKIYKCLFGYYSSSPSFLQMILLVLTFVSFIGLLTVLLSKFF